MSLFRGPTLGNRCLSCCVPFLDYIFLRLLLLAYQPLATDYCELAICQRDSFDFSSDGITAQRHNCARFTVFLLNAAGRNRTCIAVVRLLLPKQSAVCYKIQCQLPVTTLRPRQHNVYCGMLFLSGGVEPHTFRFPGHSPESLPRYSHTGYTFF